VQMILVRHAVRDADDDNGGLSRRGTHQATILADALKRRGVEPDLYLTSGRTHAKRTAEHLIDVLTPGSSSVVLDALTPDCGPGGIDDVVEEAARANHGLESASCVVLVGHEGRLSDLVTELTSNRSRPIGHGHAMCITAGNIHEFLVGHGKACYRYPTADHQEEAVRAKVTSKMTVSTFLAGFVFTALSAILVLDVDDEGWPWHRDIAIIALTLSLVLFIAAVYIYDQLGTPAGFWTDADRPRTFWGRLYRWQEMRAEHRWTAVADRAGGDPAEGGKQADDHPEFYRITHDGPAYWLMVRTSRLVFTPAIVLALAGFTMMLVGTEDWWISAGGIGGVVIAGGYAAWYRPDLGAD
jgi:phosphohistidine phosphatase SixA